MIRVKPLLRFLLAGVGLLFVCVGLTLGYWWLYKLSPMRHLAEPARLTIEEHWRRATGTIVAAIASFRRVQMFQAAAARQIDAADYALQHLLKDLCLAMPIPADGSALRAILATAGGTAAPADEALAA